MKGKTRHHERTQHDYGHCQFQIKRVSTQQADFTALKTIFAQFKLCKTIQQNRVWVTAVRKSFPGLLAGGACSSWLSAGTSLIRTTP